MIYFEKAKEYVAAFPYWQQAIVFASGAVVGSALHAIAQMLHTRRAAQESRRKGLAVSEFRNKKANIFYKEK